MTDANEVRYFTKLDTEECWKLLASVEVGRVAWNGDHGISVLPVNFLVDGATIVFHTSPDSPLAKVADGRDVAFQVDEVDSETAHGWSVLVRGQGRPADDGADNVTWLDGSRNFGIAIAAAEIDGRVVSGAKRT